MSTIKIYTTFMSYRLRTDASARPLDIGYLELGPPPYFTLAHYIDKFSQYEYDHRLRKSVRVKRYLHYNEKEKMLYLPRYDLEDFCTFLTSHNKPYEIIELPLCNGLDVDIPINTLFKERNQEQIDAVDNLVNNEDNLRGLSLSMGVGKTFSTIKSLSLIGKRAIVCVAGLLEQWVLEIKKFTLLQDEDIFTIEGGPSVSKLLRHIDKTIFPKIIICSIGTLRQYAGDKPSYINYPAFEEFCNITKIGVRVTDETHLNFHSNYIVDLRWNTAINIVLTATFGRTEKDIKLIFDQHYPVRIRHGEGIFDKYVDTYAYNYKIGMGMIPAKAYMTQRGYSHIKFEDWLLKNKAKLFYIYERVYKPIIDGHYINTKNTGEKCLILCSQTDMCEWLKQQLLLDYPELIVEKFIQGSPGKVLREADIIVSTPLSAGTGTDVKNLRTMLVTISIGSDLLNRQTFGRLRDLPDGETPIFVYCWNVDIQSHYNHHSYSRKPMLIQRSKSYHEVSI